MFASRAVVAVTSVPEGMTYLRTAGHTAAGDRGGGLYQRVVSEPNHPGKVQSSDGAWWELIETEPTPWQFGADGRYGVTNVDDTDTVQAALDYAVYQQLQFMEHVGSLTDAYTASLPSVYLAGGRFKLTRALTHLTGYLRLRGEGATLSQATAGEDILDGSTYCYVWEVRGINFVGGRHHANMGNPNINNTRLEFYNCNFRLSSDYALKTAGTGGWHHLSAHLLAKDCTLATASKFWIIAATWQKSTAVGYKSQRTILRVRRASSETRASLPSIIRPPYYSRGRTAREADRAEAYAGSSRWAYRERAESAHRSERDR